MHLEIWVLDQIHQMYYLLIEVDSLQLRQALFYQ